MTIASTSPTSASNPPATRVHAALISVQIAFATLTVAGKLVLAHLPPSALAAARLLGAATLFVVLARHRGALYRMPRRDFLGIVACGVMGMAANQLLFLSGLRHTTAINAAVLVTTIPVFTVLIAALVGKERLTLRTGAGIATALSGVLYLVGVEAFTVGPETVVGDLLIVINAACYGSYLVLAKDLVARHGSLTVVALASVSAAVFVLPFGGPALFTAELSWSTWGLVGFIVLVPTVYTYLANAWALRFASRSVVAIYIYLQPVAAAVFAISILGEALSPRVLVAAALVFAGIALVTLRRVGRAAR